MRADTVVVSEPDMLQLAEILDTESRWPAADRRSVRALWGKLAVAAVVPEDEVPSDVVTLQSRVHLEDLDTGRHTTGTLVLPAHASATAARISVLSPLGAALLGRRQGDEVEHTVHDGRRRLRIDRMLFQPEAARRR
jgi:regulator of nucleoside diphosphate kinase